LFFCPFILNQIIRVKILSAVVIVALVAPSISAGTRAGRIQNSPQRNRTNRARSSRRADDGAGMPKMVSSGGTFYTSEAAFLAAINPTFYVEDFGGFGYGTPLNGSQTTYNSPGANGYTWTASCSTGLFSSPSALSTNFPNVAISINFTGATVTALGGLFSNVDFNANAVPGTVTVTTSDGGSHSITLATPTSGFLGYRSSVPITSVTMSVTNAANYVQFDHFYSAAFGGQSEVGPNYTVYKEIKSNQSDAGTIALAPNPYRIEAFVQAASSGSITGGTMSLPAGSSATSPQTLVPQTNPQNDGTYGFQQNFAAQATLNSNYADGTYGLQITGASSTIYNASLSVTGDVYPSLTPTITNTNWSGSALVVNPDASFTLTWGAFTGSTASDRIGLGIGRVQDSTVSFQVLPASATSVTFPASYFQSNQSYTLHLVFLKVATTDTTDIPGSTGFGGFGTETKFDIQPVVFKIVPTRAAANTIHLQCLGVPSAVNRIESSPNLSPNSFTTLTSVTADSGGAFSFDDTNAGTKKFYRIAYP
jgi:hypothetical protein